VKPLLGQNSAALVEEEVSQTHEASLPFACPGRLYKLTERALYENLEMTLDRYLCETADAGDGPGFREHLIDSHGDEWTPDELRAAELVAFRDKHHRPAPDPREELEDDPAGNTVFDDIWFATRLEDDEAFPNKEALLSMSESDRDALLAERRQAMQAQAAEVASQLRNGSGLDILDSSPGLAGDWIKASDEGAFESILV